MRQMINHIKPFLCCLFAVTLLVGCEWAEVDNNYYQTYDDAVKSGALTRGWIPQGIPNSAINIYEQHIIDTNEVWIRFDLETSDRAAFVKGMQLMTWDDIEDSKFRRPQGADWWFEALIQQAPANAAALYADLFAGDCERIDGTAFIAVDSLSPRIYYWCEPGR